MEHVWQVLWNLCIEELILSNLWNMYADPWTLCWTYLVMSNLPSVNVFMNLCRTCILVSFLLNRRDNTTQVDGLPCSYLNDRRAMAGGVSALSRHGWGAAACTRHAELRRSNRKHIQHTTQ